MWVHSLVYLMAYVIKGNTYPPKVYAQTQKPKSLHNDNGKDEMTNSDKMMFLHCGA